MNKRLTYGIICLCFCVFSLRVSAQSRKLQNQPYADQKVFHFGFTLGLHTQDLILTQSGFKNDNNEVWFAEIPSYSPGFTVGIISDLYLNKYMNLRAIPSLCLGAKSFTFREQSTGEEHQTSIKNNYISLPIQVKVTGGRVNNYRPYVVAGSFVNLELASKKGAAVLLKPLDYGWEIGLGCDFYLPLFKLSPELKFGFGLKNILETRRTDITDNEIKKYATSLSEATSRWITLSFNFE